MSDVLEQLRAIADGRGSAPDKELHPDAELLHAVATYLDLCAEVDAIDREARQRGAAFYRVGNPEFDAMRAQKKGKENQARCILNRVGKTPAVTAAGVYAKATIIATRQGYLNAPGFAFSLASDLVNNPTLRASLWPTEVA
jgi:hypothetical protein